MSERPTYVAPQLRLLKVKAVKIDNNMSDNSYNTGNLYISQKLW